MTWLERHKPQPALPADSCFLWKSVELVPQAILIPAGLQVNHCCHQGTPSQPCCVSSRAYLCGWPGPQPGIILQLGIWPSSSSLLFFMRASSQVRLPSSPFFFSCISFGLSTLLNLVKRQLSEDWCNKFHAVPAVREVFSAHYSSSSWSLDR